MSRTAEYHGRMLILSRAVGEATVVGNSRLVVRRLHPSVCLVYIRPGFVEEFELQPEELAAQPTISLAEAKVKVIGINDRELQLGFDAPRSVLILRDELR